MAAIAAESLTTQVQQCCEFLLGTPYGSHFKTAAIGSPADVAVLQEYNEFNAYLQPLDCVTFVEAVLAGVLSVNQAPNDAGYLEQYAQQLQAIRYHAGQAVFTARNHFMCVDWIANNRNILQDITAHLGFDVQEAQAQINKLAWLQKHAVLETVRKQTSAEALTTCLQENLPGWSKPQSSCLPYIRLADCLSQFAALRQALPKVSIVNIVRPNWDLVESIGTALNTSHLGWAVEEGSAIWFYHASSVGEKQVVKVPLLEYLSECQSSPTIAGINVLEVLS